MSHSVTVLHAGGRALTIVRGESLATWTRKPRNRRQSEGVTIRTDNLPAEHTIRFDNAQFVEPLDL